MRRPLSVLLVAGLLVGVVLPLTGCGRKVTVTTGEIVLCTAGEIIEDNTEQLEVPADKVADYSVTTTVITCDRHADLTTLYTSAQKAIAEGDLVAARDRLRIIVERDPTYRKAADQLAAIDGGGKPTADTGDGTPGGTPGGAPGGTPGGTPETPEEPIGPVANLAQYVPDSISGYSAQGIIADVGSLSRLYLPTGGKADQLVIAVDQMVDAKAASQAASAVVADYPLNTATKQVGGAKVTVGVRDSYVVAAFADGAVLIAVELHAKSGSGSALVDAALAVVQAVSR